MDEKLKEACEYVINLCKKNREEDKCNSKCVILIGYEGQGSLVCFVDGARKCLSNMRRLSE